MAMGVVGDDDDDVITIRNAICLLKPHYTAFVLSVIFGVRGDNVLMATIGEAMCVSIDGLAGTFFLHPIRRVGEHRFFKICKGDHKISRLLFGRSTSNERPLTPTGIVETLIKMRNEKRTQLVDAMDDESQGQAQENLGLDAGCVIKKRKMVHDDVLPETVTIDAPAVGDVSSMSMVLLMGPHTSPLWLEATPENIDYMRACVAQQSMHKETSSAESIVDSAISEASSESQPKADDLPSCESESHGVVSCPGISWVKSRGAFRVRFKDDGNRKWKDFRASSMDAQDIGDALEMARSFQGSL